MCRIILISLIGWMTIVSMAAAQPDTLWTRTFGGSDDEESYSVQQTTDGGYIITGYTSSYGAGFDDACLVKTDASGIEQWSQTFGGSGSERGSSLDKTSDGGYIIAGSTTSYGAGYFDVYLIKTDALGNEQWNQTFGGGDLDFGYSVQQTSDSGYIITGQTESYGAGSYDVWLIKTYALGIEQWSQTFGGSGSDYGYSVQQTDDGGYIIAGSTLSYGAGLWDVYLIKTDASGIEQWSRTFGGSYDDRGNSVQQTTDGGYIIAGYTHSYGAGGMDVYLIKTDASGIEQWSQTFGGSGGDYGNSVQQTGDGGYIIAGTAFPLGTGSGDVYLIKTDTLGVEQWSQTFGGLYREDGYSVQQTSDSGYIIAGQTESYGAGGSNVYLIRLASDVSVRPQDPNKVYEFQLIPAFPNPFNATTTIRFDLPAAGWVKLEVFDVAGRFVEARSPRPYIEGWRDRGTHEITFDGSDLASGIYIYRLSSGDFTASGKMLLLK